MTAIGVVETLSIPLGVLAGDQMVKTAQVDLVTAQTVCAGQIHRGGQRRGGRGAFLRKRRD